MVYAKQGYAKDGPRLQNRGQGLIRASCGVEAQQFGGGGFNSKKVFAPRGRADQSCYKVGPLRARVKSAKVRPTPYVYFPRVLKAYKGPKGRYTVGLAPLVARGALPLAGYIQLPRLIKCVLLVKKRKVCIHNNRGFLCVHTTPTRTAAHASRQGVTGPAGGARGLFQKNVPEVALPLSC